MRSRTTTGTPSVLLAGAVVAVCGGVNIACGLWFLAARPALNSDFMAFWSFATFARRHVTWIYQATALQAFQQLLYPGFRSFYPFLYAPSFLLPIRWLCDWRFATAETIWTLTGLGALIFAAAMFFPARMRWFAVAALLASPAALLNGVAGETGYFTTALLLAGFALLPARPLAAGIAFGLLTLKPQLCLLLPFALLARGEWRAIAAACLTALALIVLSCICFPPGLWLDWLRSLPNYQAEILAAGKTLNLNIIVTVIGNLMVVGTPPRIAWGLQAVASFGSAAAVYLAFRHAPYRLAVAALLVGTLLCAPHAYVYDTIPLPAAMLILRPRSTAGIVLSAGVYLAPYLLLTSASRWFLYAIPETLLFMSTILLAIAPARRPDSAHEHVPAAEPHPVRF